MLSSLSMSARVVAASIEEHVMYCFSTCWLNGQQEWRVQHEAEKGTTHLQVSGVPPEELETLRQGALARQLCHDDEIGVDYVFDVPLELAKRVVGFRHDEGAPGPELEFFEILKVDERARDPAQERALEILVAVNSRSALLRSVPPLRSSSFRRPRARACASARFFESALPLAGSLSNSPGFASAASIVSISPCSFATSRSYRSIASLSGFSAWRLFAASRRCSAFPHARCARMPVPVPRSWRAPAADNPRCRRRTA